MKEKYFILGFKRQKGGFIHSRGELEEIYFDFPCFYKMRKLEEREIGRDFLFGLHENSVNIFFSLR